MSDLHIRLARPKQDPAVEALGDTSHKPMLGKRAAMEQNGGAVSFAGKRKFSEAMAL